MTSLSERMRKPAEYAVNPKNWSAHAYAVLRWADEVAALESRIDLLLREREEARNAVVGALNWLHGWTYDDPETSAVVSVEPDPMQAGVILHAALSRLSPTEKEDGSPTVKDVSGTEKLTVGPTDTPQPEEDEG